MFTSKKDDQIIAHENQMHALNKKIQSFKERLGNCQKAYDEKVAELISTQESRSELQEYYSREDARLRRMVHAEKTRRINSDNANKRKLLKLRKMLDS